MNLNVQEYLRTHSLNDLSRDHGVRSRISQCGRKVSLSYGKTDVRDDDVVAQECRGLVLARARFEGVAFSEDAPVGDTLVLALPFHRFFNHGQAAAEVFDLRDSVIYEKVDGTLCIVYFDPFADRWCVATRGVPDADVAIGSWAGDLTFAGLFENTLRAVVGGHEGLTPAEFFQTWARGCLVTSNTYLFELCTPLNRVVVRYTRPLLFHLGTRNLFTGEEFRSGGLPGVPACPELLRVASIESLVEFVLSRDPGAHEGVIACLPRSHPRGFARVKVKNPEHLALSRLKDETASPRGAMTLVLGGHLSDEVLEIMDPDVREWASRMDDLFKKARGAHVKGYVETMNAIAHIDREADPKGHRKAFAVLARENPHIHFAAAMEQYQGRCDGLNTFVENARDPATGKWSPSFVDGLIAWLEASS